MPHLWVAVFVEGQRAWWCMCQLCMDMVLTENMHNLFFEFQSLYRPFKNRKRKKSAFLSAYVYWINIYILWSHWKSVFMASFPCASGCGFVSERCNILFLSGRHFNIFPLSLCLLLIMWMRGLLCFLLKAFVWDYFIIIFESDNSMNIKQSAVRSFACHLSPAQWVSSGFWVFFISTSSSIWCFICFIIWSSFSSLPPPFLFGMPFYLPLISSRKVLELATFLYSKDS